MHGVCNHLHLVPRASGAAVGGFFLLGLFYPLSTAQHLNAYSCALLSLAAVELAYCLFCLGTWYEDVVERVNVKL